MGQGEVGEREGEGPESRIDPEGEGFERKVATPGAPPRDESEAESLLGPSVRSPVGIPRDYKPLESSMHEIFRVELEEFAGPLDLLLYLIRKHDIDIFDIPIKFITEKYLEMVEAMSTLPIDVAAEFLVLAAELTHIKSKMLLPAREGVAVDHQEQEVDPRAELVRRLLEYQKYRDAAHQLADRDLLGRDVFARTAGPDLVAEVDPGLRSVSVFKLVELMAGLIRRDEGRHEIALEPVSIAERIEYVLAFGDAREGRFSLIQLLQATVSRGELVVTFIAILEMTRLGMLKLREEIANGAPRGIGPDPVSGDTLEDVLSSPDRSETSDGATTASELPVIWVELTGKRIAAGILDDYR